MSLREDVERVIEQYIRPVLARDGGNIAVVNVEEHSGTVMVQLLGACKGCPMSQMTLAMFVEDQLKQKIPSVTKVVPV
jgi:Fe-S cluster biogenesis protein NfuA